MVLLCSLWRESSLLSQTQEIWYGFPNSLPWMCELECLSSVSILQEIFEELDCLLIWNELVVFLGQAIPSIQASESWHCPLDLWLWYRAECSEPISLMPLLCVCQDCLASAASQHLSKQTKSSQTLYLLEWCNLTQWICHQQWCLWRLFVSVQFQRPRDCKS